MNYVIIGAGAAGIAAAEEIRAQNESDSITVISSDEFVHSRCMLHKYIAGERDEKGLSFVEQDFFQRNKINWIKGLSVSGIDTEGKKVCLSNGEMTAYDKLLIASGANSFIPPVGDFREAKNVFGLRHLRDAQAIRTMAGDVERVLIVGSGLVGLDAAYGLLEMGKEITIVEMAERILPMQLDEHAALEYQRLFTEAGCRFVLGRKANEAACGEDGKIHEVVLDNGEVIPCDMVIVAAGVRPAAEFIEGSGIHADRGIVVDKFLETTIKDIYAAGDVAGLSGIWPNAMKQGRTAARNMCGMKEAYEDTYALKNTINFFGLVSLCIGPVSCEPDDEIQVMEDRRLYKRAVTNGNKLKSMLLQGDISHAGIWQYLIKNEVDLSGLEKSVFQLTFADFYGVGEDGKYAWNI